MDLLQTFNKLGACDFTTEKLSELDLHKPYRVNLIQSTTTTFGRRIIISLSEVEGIIYLPERFKALSDEDLESLLKIPNLHMIYKGKKSIQNGRTAHELEFVSL